RTDAQGDRKIPTSTRIGMHEAHRLLANSGALFAVDWAEGQGGRLEKQAGSFDEFMADLHLAYVAAGPSLRAHIRSLPEGSPAREAWDLIYGELRDRIFGGLEYDFSSLPPVPPKPGLKLIPGGKQPPKPPTAIEVPQGFLDAQIGPHNAIQEKHAKGLAAGRDPGVGRHEHNEDRFAVAKLKAADGKPMTRFFAIDGMGGHEGGEFAAVFTQYILEAALRNPHISLEAAVKLADKKMLQHPEFKRLKGEPGAVLAGVEAKQISDSLYEVRLVDVGDSEAMVFEENFQLQGEAYTTKEPRSSKKLPRGQTLITRLDPFAHVVDQAVGGHYRDGKNELDVGVEVHYARKGSIAVAGSDGFTENFVSKDEIGEVLRNSGAKNAAEMELALRNEALLRMNIFQDFRASGRLGQAITHADFVKAYEKVWKQTPPAGKWRYEGLILLEKGRVVDPSKDPKRDGTAAYFRGTFKLDNISVVVHVLGEGESGSGQPLGVRVDFRPAPLPPLVANSAAPAPAIPAQGGKH
ncbi:MAG: hypothetical protein K8R69_10335, partial [Deltaproteobacteria bacterium]|nr:hypothetical protein [Deltaproteobacteria bacterium]